MDRPKVGVGVVLRRNGKVLLGKRKGAHGEGEWSLPGGHLEAGEAFNVCCTREVKEETNLDIKNVHPLPYFTNDIFKKENLHYVTLFFQADVVDPNILQNMEPHKCEAWDWFDPKDLPSPTFGPFTQLVKNYLMSCTGDGPAWISAWESSENKDNGELEITGATIYWGNYVGDVPKMFLKPQRKVGR